MAAVRKHGRDSTAVRNRLSAERRTFLMKPRKSAPTYASFSGHVHSTGLPTASTMRSVIFEPCAMIAVWT